MRRKKCQNIQQSLTEVVLFLATINKGSVVVTQPGQFPCKAILHVCGEKTPGHVEALTERIVNVCEAKGYKSVAIPAICTGGSAGSLTIPRIRSDCSGLMCAGAGGMQPGVVAGALLRGIKNATTSNRLQKLRDIRVVLYKINVFLAFREEAKQMFSTVYCPGTRGFSYCDHPESCDPSKYLLEHICVDILVLLFFTSCFNHDLFFSPSGATLARNQQQDQQLSAAADLSLLSDVPASRQSVFLVLGLCRKNVDDAKAKLTDLYQNQCSTHIFKKEELEGLVQEDIDSLMQLVETHGLHSQHDQSGNLLVGGQKDGVNQVVMVINASLQETLRREVRLKEEEDLYARVVWCIMNHNGRWERLPKAANYNLEKKDVAGGVVDAQGVTWTVDLKTMEATNVTVAEARKIKRLENLPGKKTDVWNRFTVFPLRPL